MSTQAHDGVTRYSLLDALIERRSRRFGLGMQMASGPLAFRSQQPPLSLSEDEEAPLVFAACGITGHALLDLPFAPGEGGAIVARSVGRTIASGDAIQTVSLFVTNDESTYLIKRPQDFAADQIGALIDLARQKQFTELYRRLRVKIADGRAAPPLTPMFKEVYRLISKATDLPRWWPSVYLDARELNAGDKNGNRICSG